MHAYGSQGPGMSELRTCSLLGWPRTKEPVTPEDPGAQSLSFVTCEVGTRCLSSSVLEWEMKCLCCSMDSRSCWSCH